MNKPKPKPTVKAPVAAAPKAPAVKADRSSVFPFSFQTKCIILILLGLVFYSNTLQNGYLLDDNLTIVANDYVQQGFSGIKTIMTTDAYTSFMQKTGLDKHKLSGGRYRPLSIVVFAIEHSVFGESTFMRHLVNLILFCALLLVVFWFIDRYVFMNMKGGGDIAFLAVILFAIHPIHTEVVANVKSLDEILSLLFIVLTFIFGLRYINHHKKLDLVIGGVCYFLSLLAKEYAITLLILLPVLFYLVGNKTPKEAFVSSLPYYGVFILYLVLRINAVGIPHHVVSNDSAINPYLYATPIQAIATKLFVLGKYLYMLFIPYPLSYDYNYAQIPYYNLFDIPVLVSILVYIGIIASAGWLLYKKNILTFPVLFFLLNIALVSNFFMDIGATMGERLIFHSSLGFAMLLSYGAFVAINKYPYKVKQAIIFSSLALLTVICGAETLKRNTKWKDIYVLATTDVKTSSNSLMANDYAAISFIYLADTRDSAIAKTRLRQAIECARKCEQITNTYYDGYYRLGIAYSQLSLPDSAIYYLEMARTINAYDTNVGYYLANIYLTNGINLGRNGNVSAAVIQMWKGINVNPYNPNIWYNLGGAYFSEGKYDSAKFAWTKTLAINPNYANAANGLNALPK